MVAVKGRERPTILSVYAQMLLIGLKYNVTTNLEEWGRAPNHIHERSKRASKSSPKHIHIHIQEELTRFEI